MLQEQVRWEQETLDRNLKALQTPDPRWQPPDVRPQRAGKLTLREKMAADYVYQMTKNNIWCAPAASEGRAGTNCL